MQLLRNSKPLLGPLLRQLINHLLSPLLSSAAVACMGFVFLNATRPARSFVHSLLREKLRQLDLDVVRYYNDQQHMNQALVHVSVVWSVGDALCVLIS
jgi:hypothetical protein